MALLILAALIWLGIHIGVAGTRLRDVLVTRIGEGPFRGLFSLLSILAIGLLVWSWSAAWTTPLWNAPAWLRWLLVAVMLVAFVLFVASVSRRNPTMISGEAATAQPPIGIHRVTRHPMLWSFALWAAVHIIGNGDTAAIVFFGDCYSSKTNWSKYWKKLWHRSKICGRNRAIGWRVVFCIPGCLLLL
jgi:uncharacterized membrane protein